VAKTNPPLTRDEAIKHPRVGTDKAVAKRNQKIKANVEAFLKTNPQFRPAPKEVKEDMAGGFGAPPTNSVGQGGAIAGITGEPPVDNRKFKPNQLRRKAPKTLKELREQWTSSRKTD
jgi:hypothetical protein